MARGKSRENTRQAKLALYRELILEAAERVFAEQGFASSKIQDVADEAGIALGTLYKSYSGKAAIFGSIHEHRSRELIARCEASMDPDASPLCALLDYVSSYLTFLLAHPDYLRMHLDESSAWGFGARFDSRVQAEAWQRAHDTELQFLVEGIREGIFVDRDPSLLVRTLASIQQVQLAWWIESDGALPAEELLEQMRVDLVRAVCRAPVAAWLEGLDAEPSQATRP